MAEATSSREWMAGSKVDCPGVMEEKSTAVVPRGSPLSESKSAREKEPASSLSAKARPLSERGRSLKSAL